MKRIIVYAHYYYPDVASTGQLLKDLCEKLIDKMDVTVICTVPSYAGVISREYKNKKYYYEEINGVHIIRVRVPEFNKGNKFSRIANLAVYFIRAINASIKVKNVDYVFSISQPPLLGGILGSIGKKIKHAKYIYNIQDFNPEQIIAVGYFKNKFLLNCVMALDKCSCKKSDLIVTVGQDLCDTIEKRFANKKVPKYVMINNWVDEEKIFPLESDNSFVVEFKQKYGLENKFVIMYSGNIGLYYDLENIIKVIEKFGSETKSVDGRSVAFAFVGNGSVLKKLMSYTTEHNMSNVVFIPYQDKEKIIYSLNAADVHWCVNAKGIKGVSCPSKVYGELAVAKPILAVLEKGAEVEKIIRLSEAGIVCEPGDYKAIYDAISFFVSDMSNESLKEMGQKGHEYLMKNLTKNQSIQKYINEIECL